MIARVELQDCSVQVSRHPPVVTFDHGVLWEPASTWNVVV